MRCTWRYGCDNEATISTRCDEHTFTSSSRRWILTDKGKRAIGVPVMVDVPLLELPWYEEHPA